MKGASKDSGVDAWKPQDPHAWAASSSYLSPFDCESMHKYMDFENCFIIPPLPSL